jgi:hypothetical protein
VNRTIQGEYNVKTLLTYTTFALLAVVSMGQAQAACGGGGYQTPAKTQAAAPEKQTAVQANYVTVSGSSVDSTRFDAMSSRLDLSKGQSKEIKDAKSAINDVNKKLAKAQSNAQQKLDNCGDDCADAKRNLVRSTEALIKYNTNSEFDLRLRSILRPSQALTYFPI